MCDSVSCVSLGVMVYEVDNATGRRVFMGLRGIAFLDVGSSRSYVADAPSHEVSIQRSVSRTCVSLVLCESCIVSCASLGVLGGLSTKSLTILGRTLGLRDGLSSTKSLCKCDI